jgi:2-amino-4-hydroxy-6-hydroxymethyldihydropteridine diphosphokinase
VKTVYIGIGSNLGDREQNLREAREHLSEDGVRIVRASSIYETAPRDLAAQPWFLNQVVEAETELLPLQMLRKLQRIERSMGRRKIVAKGPRVIDLDILLFGRAIIQSAGLEIPHPRMIERRFVLEPLAEIAPDLRLPSRTRPPDARTVREMLAKVADQEVRRMAPHLESDLTI